MARLHIPLNEQVALITGGGSGIGRALAGGLLANGCKVVIASRRNEVIHRTAAELNAAYPKARVYPYVVDVRSADQTDRLVRWMHDTFGRVDILVNNAGVADHSDILGLTDDTWDYVMETNLRAAMWLMRGVLPGMKERNFGDIINIVSQAGRNGYGDVPAYCAAKHGLIGLGRAVNEGLQKEKRNIRVFNLCPSLVDVSNTAEQQVPREGTLHVRTMVKTMLFCLSLDRTVRLGEIDLLAASGVEGG